MSIRPAQKTDLDIVRTITHTTIGEIYPHYYPGGAVEFFLEHHSSGNISDDIMNGRVFLCLDNAQNVVGTVTVRKNEICRLFVLPGFQGNGYGKELLEFAENRIAESYDEIVIDASLSAKSIYLKRGYKEIGYNMIKTRNNDRLCYDVMKKIVTRKKEQELC